MGQALNTTVNGSSGMCVDAADWLSSLYAGANGAAEALLGARHTATTVWHGPAHDAFSESLNGLPADTDDLADRAYQCEWALREFAAALDKAVDTMNQALAKAGAGGLRIDGPFIIAPQAPALPPDVPTRCTPGMVTAELTRMRDALAHYDAAADVYNAKAAVYNQCKALVEDARKIEKRAHEQLRGSAVGVTEATTDMVSIGATVASRMLGQLGSMENPRRDVANTVERLTNQSKFLTDWAYGKVDSCNPLFKRTLDLAAAKSRNSVQYRERVTEFEKFLSTVPQEARAAITSYPGKAALDSGATKALRAMPYLGGILTAANEARGALTGEQSWGKAAVDTAAITAGSAVGAAGAGALAGAILGAPAGPVGGFVVGTIGGIAGAIGGQKVINAFVPG